MSGRIERMLKVVRTLKLIAGALVFVLALWALVIVMGAVGGPR